MEYGELVLVFRRDVPSADERRTLAEHAEYGRWELARRVVYAGGLRRAWLRRRIIRVRRTA